MPDLKIPRGEIVDEQGIISPSDRSANFIGQIESWNSKLVKYGNYRGSGGGAGDANVSVDFGVGEGDGNRNLFDAGNTKHNFVGANL